MLKENNFFQIKNLPQMFIDVFLVKYNEVNTTIPYLEGKGLKPITNNNYCIYDKLKITCTSKSNKCQFRLLFQLYKFDGSRYLSIPNATAVSNPIEVFSHSNYLKEEHVSPKKYKTKPSPPMLTMIIPTIGSPGDRCVILGANFIESKWLSVKIGNMIIKPEYHENGTLIITIPPSPPDKKVEIQVSNDGEEYSRNHIFFSYAP